MRALAEAALKDHTVSALQSLPSNQRKRGSEGERALDALLALLQLLPCCSAAGLLFTLLAGTAGCLCPLPLLQEHEQGMRRLLDYALALEGEVTCSSRAALAGPRGCPFQGRRTQ